jgi:hypothetical protein
MSLIDAPYVRTMHKVELLVLVLSTGSCLVKYSVQVPRFNMSYLNVTSTRASSILNFLSLLPLLRQRSDIICASRQSKQLD